MRMCCAKSGRSVVRRVMRVWSQVGYGFEIVDLWSAPLKDMISMEYVAASNSDKAKMFAVKP